MMTGTMWVLMTGDMCADANTGVTESSSAGHCCAYASAGQEQKSR